MQIKHLTEGPDGNKVTFQGVLDGNELAFVLEIGLETLIKAGAIPFTSTNEARTVADVHLANDTEH